MAGGGTRIKARGTGCPWLHCGGCNDGGDCSCNCGHSQQAASEGNLTNTLRQMTWNRALLMMPKNTIDNQACALDGNFFPLKLQASALSRNFSTMKVLMACGRLGSRFLQTGGFATWSCRLDVALLRVAALGRLVPQCSATGQLKSKAPIQQIEAKDNAFVKPLSNVYFIVPCRVCQGLGVMKCDVCNGQGSLARGGFHKQNPVAIVQIVGSKWTVMESAFGWRHFHVHNTWLTEMHMNAAFVLLY